MRRARAAGLTIAVLLASTASTIAAQQSSGPPPPREQVHPELVDTTWGPRTAAAWQLALSHHWEDARTRFWALHAEYPHALEALVGLGFVSRATGDRDDARRWFREAASVEPTSADVRQQVEATEWDRPGNVSLGGDAARIGSRTTWDYSVGVGLPITPEFSMNVNVGILGAGDPLRGIFVDTTKQGGVDAHLYSTGFVVRPIETLAIASRVEVWTANDTTQTFFWIDATQRLNDHFALRVGTRPTGGQHGAAQFTGAADITFVRGETVSLEVVQAARNALFEPRTQFRVFYLATPTVRGMIRLGLLRDTGPANQATTGFVAATMMFTPTLGIRADLSKRQGAFERSSAGGGIVFRW